MSAASRIVRAEFEPIKAKNLLPIQSRLRAITAMHEPGTAPPDFDHPMVKAMVNRLPHCTRGQLEAMRDLLMKDDGRWQFSKSRDRDGWLRLVNAELQQRDLDNEQLAASLIDFFSQGARS